MRHGYAFIRKNGKLIQDPTTKNGFARVQTKPCAATAADLLYQAESINILVTAWLATMSGFEHCPSPTMKMLHRVQGHSLRMVEALRPLIREYEKNVRDTASVGEHVGPPPGPSDDPPRV